MYHNQNSFSFFCNKVLPLFMAVMCCGMLVMAQRDTTKTQSINITSSYKPVLRNAVKINFSGTQLEADTNRSVRGYNIPSQNLFYAYQPISLKPLALQQDSNLYLGGRNFVKAGFGSYTTPFVSAGLSFGDGKTSLVNVYGHYTGSKGDIRNQDFTELAVKATGSYFTPKNEIYASADVSRKDFYFYGYDHFLYDPKKEDIRQQFQEFNVSAGIRNTVANDYGINYNPQVRVGFFTNTDRLTETTFGFTLPVEKKFGEKILAKLELQGDFTGYSTRNQVSNRSFNNDVLQLSPSIVYSVPRFTINAGIIPVWDNGQFRYLPNIYAEGQLQEKVFLIQAGWVGRIVKNTFGNLSKINPYLAILNNQANTRETELYGGIKASIGKHFTFSAKAGLVTYSNFPIFINDYSVGADGRQFVVRHEPSMNNFRIHGDLSFISQDKFTATAGLNLNGYTGMDVNDKAWNTIPMEFTGALRWWAFKRVMLKGDFYMFGGGKYLDKGNSSMSFKGGSDLSAGAEFKINRQFSAFLDVNNIFGNKYERWHQYEVYGLNVLGGIIIHF